MADSFITVAPDSTGKQLQTTTKTVNSQTVHRQVITTASARTRVGLYRVHAGVFTILVTAHAATAGFWWLINPVGSSVAVSVKKVTFSSQHGSALATPTSPRVTLERTTFTGTASGATVTPAKRVRTAVAGLAADATAVASVRTASTGLTLTAGEQYKAFLPVVALTTAAANAAGTDEYDPADEDAELILAAGEGIICRQADGGTTSDTRRVIMNITWEEFTAP